MKDPRDDSNERQPTGNDSTWVDGSPGKPDPVSDKEDRSRSSQEAPDPDATEVDAPQASTEREVGGGADASPSTPVPPPVVSPPVSAARAAAQKKAADAQEIYKIPKTPLKGKYEFLKVVGAGGAGVIYKARQQPIGRVVAVKMIHSHVLSRTAMKRFQQEAKTISTLSHPNIISVYDFGLSEDDQPFMVMDFVEGTPLSELIKESGSLPIETVKSIVIQLCDGLAHAHAKGVLHRDLKPNNVMILSLETGALHAKILDFGLAKVETETGEQEHLTRTGETVGTPAFMSPEQVMGRKLDPRSDIYSLGCLMYHCLAGQPPFVGETKMETMLLHLNESPPPVNEKAGKDVADPTIDRILSRLLEKDPGKRFQTTEELRIAIINAAEESATDEQTPLESLQEAVQEPTPPEIPSVDRRPIPPAWIYSALLGLLALLTIPYVVIQIQSRQPVEKSATNMEKQEPDKKSQLLLDTDFYPDEAFKGTIDNHINSDTIDSKRLTIEDKTLKHLAKARALKNLILTDSPVSNTGIGYIADLSNLGLRNLILHGTKIDGGSGNSLARMTTIEKLDLSSTSYGDQGLAPLEKLERLTSLNLAKSRVTDAGTSALARLKSLRELDLSSTAIVDAGLVEVAKLASLRKLSLADTAVTDSGIAHLVALENLRSLNLTGTKITKNCLRKLANLKYLSSLDLSQTGLTDTAVDELMKVEGLEFLGLVDCKITRSAIVEYQRSFPSVRLKMGPE